MTDPFSPFVMSAAAGDETRCDEKTHSLARRGRGSFTCIVRWGHTLKHRKKMEALSLARSQSTLCEYSIPMCGTPLTVKAPYRLNANLCFLQNADIWEGLQR